jgi:hypothetical protein
MTSIIPEILELYVRSGFSRAHNALYSGAKLGKSDANQRENCAARIVAAARMLETCVSSSAINWELPKEQLDSIVGVFVKRAGAIAQLLNPLPCDVLAPHLKSVDSGVVFHRAIRTEALHQILLIANACVTHLDSRTQIPVVEDSFLELSRYAISYISREIGSVLEELKDSGLVLNKVMNDGLVKLKAELAVGNEDHGIQRPQAIKAAKTIVDCFIKHEKLVDRDLPEKIEQLAKSLFANFDRSCEKFTVLAQQ